MGLEGRRRGGGHQVKRKKAFCLVHSRAARMDSRSLKSSYLDDRIHKRNSKTKQDPEVQTIKVEPEDPDDALFACLGRIDEVAWGKEVEGKGEM